MPHLIAEYSANLDGSVDMHELCRHLLKAALETGVFETGAVRVRAIRCDSFAVADDLPENGFIDLSLRIASGRTFEQKKAIGDRIMTAASDFLTELFKTPHFALSLEVREIDPELSWRKNAIHPRLQAVEGN